MQGFIIADGGLSFFTYDRDNNGSCTVQIDITVLGGNDTAVLGGNDAW